MIELKAILPSVEFKPEKLERDLMARYQRVQNQMRRDLQKTISTWDKKPKVRVRRKKIAGGMIFQAWVESEVWGMLDEGTDPHKIRPKPSNPTGKLWFKAPYNAKTQVGLLKSGKGGIAQDAQLYQVDEVNHPGTEARGWTPIIVERANDKIGEEADDALREWMQNVTPPTKRRRR